jgi:hypothetical protein
LPGVEPVVSWITERPLPKADPRNFNVAIAHLEDDEKGEVAAQILESLAEFPTVAVLSFDRRIVFHSGNSVVDERKGHDLAKDLLRRDRAQMY